MTDSYFREEPRFYPVREPMPIDDWIKLPRNERQRISSEFALQVEAHDRKRIRENHPRWNEKQVELFYFKLKFLGDCFYMAVFGARKKGELTSTEIQDVIDAPLPATPEEAAKYL